MLSGKQKKSLRSAANQLRPSVMIGKEGITPALIEFLEEAFNTRELVKLRVLDTCPLDIKAVAGQIAEMNNSELIQILGRTFLLFRPHPDKSVNSGNEN